VPDARLLYGGCLPPDGEWKVWNGGDMLPDLEVYIVKSNKDKPLENVRDLPRWAIPIQVGAACIREKEAVAPGGGAVHGEADAKGATIACGETTAHGEAALGLWAAAVQDDSGDNISYKNGNYCELTALYWIWKNRLAVEKSDSRKYFGLFHYRRWLDVSDADLESISSHGIDAVLPFPTVHEPDIRSHHARYVKETDWDAMLQALRELAPEYYAAYGRIFSQEYLYNYNILIAKADVLKRYCEWLFPILERAEELSLPKGSGRADRYIGYLGENLLTLYFMYHKEEISTACTGRVMLT